MVLRFIDRHEIPETQDVPRIGAVPVIGKPLEVTRAWFQCDQCGMIGALDQMASPMMPPGCGNRCEGTDT